ncbi:MAG: NEW3 domain-containing protein [Dehalococcoidales bacterium]|nr:NEW3 domain-containing protein [Dehalococcoidales bacterium]
MREDISNITIKVCYFLLAIAGLILLLSPSYTTAQEGKDGLILRYVYGGYNNIVEPGESKTLYIEIANSDNSPTTDIQFTSEAPNAWIVEFSPQSINTLNAGSYQTIEIIVTAPQNVPKGDYSITVIAHSNIGTRVMNLYMWVEKESGLWIWIGVMLGVLVIAAFIIIFKRFSRD